MAVSPTFTVVTTGLYSKGSVLDSVANIGDAAKVTCQNIEQDDFYQH